MLFRSKELFAGDREKTEELFKQSDDFAHKENVKVYRNVQAVVVEELEKQTQTIMENERRAADKSRKMFFLNIVTLAAAVGNLILLFARMTGNM